MKAKLVRKHARGFALIATISVLLLLTLVAVAFLSLSASNLQLSRSEWAQEEARANARLALKIAIGELQRELGPDRRIALTASVLDSTPDTLRIDGVSQPHWTGVASTVYPNTRNGSPFSRRDSERGLIDARGGLAYDADDAITSFLVSGNEGGPDRSGRRPLDARSDGASKDENFVTIVGEGSVRDMLEDEVLVQKVETEKEQQLPNGTVDFRANGGYAWWVYPENQKAHIARVDRHQDEGLSEDGDGIERMVHAQDAEVGAIEEFARVGTAAKDGRVLSPKTLTLLPSVDEEAVREHFFSLTGNAKSVLTNTRDGGLKKNLTAFMETGTSNRPESIPSLDASQSHYIGLEPEDRLIGPINQSYAQLQNAVNPSESTYKDVAPTFELLWDWNRLSRQFSFGRGRLVVRKQELYEDLTASQVNSLQERQNVYDRQNNKPSDPTKLRKAKITPVVTEACVYYNLAAYESPAVTPGGAIQYTLRKCIYPRVGLWNPYNVEMDLNQTMVLQLFLNGKKLVTFDDDPNFTREIYYGGQRDTFDNQFGGQIYFTLDGVTIPPGETFIFSAGGGPTELESTTARGGSFAQNRLQCVTPPATGSYFYKDYDKPIAGTDGEAWCRNPGMVRVNANSMATVPSEHLPTLPFRFRESGGLLDRHGADNYMFWLKIRDDSSQQLTLSGFADMPMLVYGSVSLQAGGGDEYPLAWPSNSFANVIVTKPGTRNLGDTAPAPNPLTRDGFRIKWLDETAENKDGGNELFLQDASMGNYNLRASYICRNPFDNVTSTPPYFHGIYLRDKPSAELSWRNLSPQAQGGFQTGFPFGKAGFENVNRVIAYELPTPEVGIPSLGYLRHLQLSEFVWHPTYAIGSSLAEPRIPRSGTLPVEVRSNNNWDRDGLATTYWAELFRNIVYELPEDNHLIFDLSYEVNHNLWSDFFLTGATENQISNFAQDPVNRPLKNGNLLLWDESGDVVEDLNDFFRAASRLMLEGGFDVHSTNKDAWKAVLSTTRDVGYSSSDDKTPFPRTLYPRTVENPEAEYSPRVFNGFRSLSEQEIDSLATQIVSEVKKRAPFFGLSDFVNRRLANDETGREGAIEAAIRSSLPNRGVNSEFPIENTEIRGQGAIRAQMTRGQTPDQETTTPMDQRSKPASTGYGMPGYVTQGDILQVIGSSLSARSDTFKIRAYGESKDVNGTIQATAWCEAVVQRTPVPIVPDDVTGLNPRPVGSGETDFGRRFEMVSFRWLSRDEV